jgi:hypothetical protein
MGSFASLRMTNDSAGDLPIRVPPISSAITPRAVGFLGYRNATDRGHSVEHDPGNALARPFPGPPRQA